jgi:hypothetical protein
MGAAVFDALSNKKKYLPLYRIVVDFSCEYVVKTIFQETEV